jgi:hypothetical protein
VAVIFPFCDTEISVKPSQRRYEPSPSQHNLLFSRRYICPVIGCVGDRDVSDDVCAFVVDTCRHCPYRDSNDCDVESCVFS